uniref:RNA helicase n=1 Tax=Physcomitrium patens TaxID=3218 RepID=A0A2K1JDV1_PHYPA|nr:hypothetical protein PHYPA_019984 [Physcomitrium patens]
MTFTCAPDPPPSRDAVGGALLDPLLSRYLLMVIDEAHERIIFSGCIVWSAQRSPEEKAGREEAVLDLSSAVLELLAVPIYAALLSEQQRRVFQPAPEGTRKLCLIKTSLTVLPSRYMIDPGLVKATACNSRAGVEPMEVVPVSKAQAQQRCRTAGWGGPAKWFWLYTEDTSRKLEDTTVPEIQHCNLVNVVSQASIVMLSEHMYSLVALANEDKLSDPIEMKMGRTRRCGQHGVSFRRCLVASFCLIAARLQLDRTHRNANSNSIQIHINSPRRQSRTQHREDLDDAMPGSLKSTSDLAPGTAWSAVAIIPDRISSNQRRLRCRNVGFRLIMLVQVHRIADCQASSRVGTLERGAGMRCRCDLSPCTRPVMREADRA